MIRSVKKLLFSLLILKSWTGLSQSKIIIEGIVKDEITLSPLPSAQLYNTETKQIVKTNQFGQFKFVVDKIGDYHITLSHLACESESYHIGLTKDTFIELYLRHYHKHIKEINIAGKNTPNIETVSSAEIDLKANENLSNILDKSTGARIIKNGNNISKPIVQGLYGNRLNILHQGITQSGQQWGNDHAPEIDPLAANKLKLITGVSSLEYKGVNMGAAILIEANKLSADPHYHGKLNLFGETNGRGWGVNLQLEKNEPLLAWRITGTYKRNGDKSTPNYYLRNTGLEEINFSFQGEKTIFKNWKTSIYLSSFNTRLGVLRGSHIGNLTDLNLAINRPIPFFTEEEFNNSIDPPRQSVQHHFWKLNSKKIIDSFLTLSFTYSGQLNNRKEYDVRRGSRSEIPALFILQYSNYVEGKWIKLKNNQSTKYGFQLNYTENINQPETGITPLIPNYSSWEPSLFFTKKYNYKKSILDLGFRTDFLIQKIYTTIRNIQKDNIEYSHNFGNISTSLSYQYFLNEWSDVVFNTGFTLRNPAINELYSFGLHQGVSSIEEGNRDLNSEKSFKSSISFQAKKSNKLHWQAQGYFQNINDFIYLKPELNPRLTIRGAYPVFIYNQTHAQIYGLEVGAKYKILEGIDGSIDYNYIRGQNLTENIPLLYIPSNRLRSEIELTKSKLGNWLNPKIQLMGSFTFKQDNLNIDQDFIPAPDAYFLLSSRFSVEHQLGKYRLQINLQSENIFNSVYRDYMNRLKYFSDEQGRNITLGLTLNY